MKFAPKLRAQIRKSSRSSSIDQTMLQCRYHEDVARGQYFTTLDDVELDKVGGSCREYTLPRGNAASKVKGWIRGNTKIGQSSSRELRNRDHVRILMFMGNDREWNKQIRD